MLENADALDGANPGGVGLVRKEVINRFCQVLSGRDNTLSIRLAPARGLPENSDCRAHGIPIQVCSTMRSPRAGMCRMCSEKTRSLQRVGSSTVLDMEQILMRLWRASMKPR